MARLVLVGLPGAGKTSLAALLAKRWGVDAVDTDDVLREMTGATAAQLLRDEGEASFRRRECQALLRVLRDDVVVATGGGVVVSEEARQQLLDAVTVWVDCEDSVLAQRVKGGDRPLLGDEPEQALARLRTTRTPWYLEVSRARIDSSGDLDDVADRVEEELRKIAP